MSFLAATVGIGVAALFPLYIAEIASGRLILNHAESWLAIAYVGLFPSLIAYLCFNRGVELLGPATARTLAIGPCADGECPPARFVPDEAAARLGLHEAEY